MTPPKARLEEVFVVRVWREAEDSAGHWRGRAEHVRSSKVRYFSNFGDLCEFIASHELSALSESSLRDRPRPEDELQPF